MRRPNALTAVLATGALVGLTTGAAVAALSASSRIGPMGVGPIVIGMTPSQARATGTALRATQPARGSTCYYLDPGEPAGLRFMVEDGTVRRAELRTPSLETSARLRVGDPVARLMSVYGKHARSAPGKYDAAVQTFTVGDSGKFRIVFTTQGGTIRAIFAGALPQIAYVEGCS